jgi:hypothetical protein
MLVLVLAASGAAAQRLPAVEAQNYERCMALARKDPTAAWERALAWKSEGGRHPAEHCASVALIGLKQYAEAGRRLEALAEAMRKTAPAELQAEVFGQAGQAWLLAGNAARTAPRASEKLSSERSSTARTNCRPISSGPWSLTW